MSAIYRLGRPGKRLFQQSLPSSTNTDTFQGPSTSAPSVWLLRFRDTDRESVCIVNFTPILKLRFNIATKEVEEVEEVKFLDGTTHERAVEVIIITSVEIAALDLY